MKLTFVLLILLIFQGHSQSSVKNKIDSDHIAYRINDVDQRPRLPQGLMTLSLFLSDNFKMPDVSNKKVKLFVSFIVEKDGTMSDLRYIHLSAIDLLDKSVEKEPALKRYEALQLDLMKSEALRVLSLFKTRWLPATKNGEAVRCIFNYPINFNLE